MFKALYCHASAPVSIAARRRPSVHSVENEYLVEILGRLTAAWKGAGHPPTQCCGSGRSSLGSIPQLSIMNTGLTFTFTDFSFNFEFKMTNKERIY